MEECIHRIGRRFWHQTMNMKKRFINLCLIVVFISAIYRFAGKYVYSNLPEKETIVLEITKLSKEEKKENHAKNNINNTIMQMKEECVPEKYYGAYEITEFWMNLSFARRFDYDLMREQEADMMLGHIVEIRKDSLVTYECFQWKAVYNGQKTRTENYRIEKVFIENPQYEWDVIVSPLISIEDALFALQKKEDGEAYEQMEDEKIKRWEETIQAAWGWDDAFWKYWAKSISAIDEYGKLLAIAAPDNSGIGIYSMENGEELIHMEIADRINTDWTIEVSQIKGDAESGWIVFSNGDVTYRMTYPEGSMERLGEFMYETTYSPDERYRAYCTANRDFRERGHFLSDEKLEKWNQVCDRWNAVTPGWYVEELETGKKTYIPIPTEDDMGSIPVRLLDGGRCVWIQKDKLLQILNS